MASVEPLPGEPAAVAHLDGERALVVADVHAGIEAGLRYERGVELDSNADERLSRLLSLLERTDAERLVVLGDLAHRIGDPDGAERDELDALVGAVTERVPLTLVRGNHDAGVAEAYGDRPGVEVVPAAGVRRGGVSLLHGHTWPGRDLFDADVVCMGHEHPTVRLEDEVGGSRVERAWLRGSASPDAFTERFSVDAEALADPPELVVFPAFNDRSGGTWVNVEGQSFLAPFLPDGLASAEAYLLDGTRLGDYRRV
jgi:putative SbcD/Mre11-related phosphoesterase